MFNGRAADFVVSQNGKSGAARFLFATEAGTDPRLVARGERHDRASSARIARAGGAVYKGLAVASDRLYATDFHNGRVDVFDASFKLITTAGGFKDPKVPKGFAPFGIQALGGNIFVTYAKQDAAAKDDVPVPGQAYVDEFTPDGQLVARVVNSGKKNAPLNAPWGLALAPADFGVFSDDLLVGNFGNGRISAYTQRGANVGLQGPAPSRERSADRDRRPLGDRVRQRCRGGSGDHPVLPLRPGRRAARPLRLDHRGLSGHERIEGAAAQCRGPLVKSNLLRTRA